MNESSIIHRVETWFVGATLLHEDELIPGSWETFPGETPKRTWVVKTLQGTQVLDSLEKGQSLVLGLGNKL